MEAQFEFASFGHLVRVSVHHGKVSREDAWLLAVPRHVVTVAKIIQKDGTMKARLHLEFCKVFKRDVSMSAFLGCFNTAKKIPGTVVAVTKWQRLEESKPRIDLAQVKLEAKREGAKKMAAVFASVRDENALVVNAVVKSTRLVYAANSLFTKEKADGSRTRLSVFGVSVPKPFPSPKVVKEHVEAVVSGSLAPYMEDEDKKIQFASLLDVVSVAVRSGPQLDNICDDEPHRLVIVDHLDALKVSNTAKRSPCRLRVFCRSLFSGFGMSDSVCWFDFDGPVQRIAEFSAWRMSELNTVMGKTMVVKGHPMLFDSWWIVGDNERLQIEQGGCTGSSICRCPLCFLPAYLFPYFPFLGQSRTVEAGRVAHLDLLKSQTRLKLMENFGKMTVSMINKLEASSRVACGSISREPLLAEGATFALSRVRVTPAVLHNTAQVFMLVKHYLNTCLPVGRRLDVKGPFMSCAERRIEMSHWKDLYQDLPEQLWFIPDCASQLSATLWQNAVATAEDAVRAQACGLVIFFVLAAKSPNDVDTNYLHNVSAHVFDFVLDVARMQGRTVDFFEEAGERETQTIRTFVQRNSNHRDNLFMGARVAEHVHNLLSRHRRRNRATAPPELSNILVAPCLVSVFDAHVESFCTFVERVASNALTQHLVVVLGECVMFLVGTDDHEEAYTFACRCGLCRPPDPVVKAVHYQNLPDDHWLRSRSAELATVGRLEAASYDSLGSMVVHPLGVEPRFEVTSALMRVIGTQPKSARHGALNKKKASELKSMCQQYEISDGGNKEMLIDRILKHEAHLHDQDVLPTERPLPSAPKVNYNNWSLADLKEECKARGLAVSGSKATVVARLEQNPDAVPAHPRTRDVSTKPAKRARSAAAAENDENDNVAEDAAILVQLAADGAGPIGRAQRERRKKTMPDSEGYASGPE